MPPRFRTAIAAVLAVSLAVLSACARSGEDRLPGVLQLRLNTNPTTLDPHLITDVLSGGISAKIFNGLVRFNEDLEIVPDLAASWTVTPDGRQFTFLLRPDARFSTGRSVTSQDFRYSFERALAPATKAPLTWVLDKLSGADDFMAGRSSRIRGIATPDDRTLVLTLDRPFGPFLSLLAMTTAYVVPKEEVERWGQDFGTHPVGTGPYVLTAWEHGQTLVLQAREDYFAGRPKLRGIRYRVIPEDLTAVLEFETGGLDALLIPSSEYRRYRTAPEWRGRVFGRTGLDSYYIGLNCTRPPFSDRRVRQAVNLAIDRERILNTLFERRGELSRGPVPPGLWKGMPGGAAGYAHDPERARRLIRDAGADGSTITIYLSADAEVLDIMEVVKEYLRSAGIHADIRQLDWSAFKSAVNRGEPDAFWLSWWADYPDPENFLFPLFHSQSVGPGGNRSRCVDPGLDSLIETAQRTLDPGRRYALYRTAEKRIVENAPWVFMWHRGDYYVVQPRVQGFRIYPIYSIDKGMDMALADR